MTAATTTASAVEQKPTIVVKAPDTRASDRDAVREDATARARNHRVMMALLTCAISVHFVGAFVALCWLALMFAWEIALPPFVARFVTPYIRTKSDYTRAMGVWLTGIGSSIYVLGWAPSGFTGLPGSSYFAALWLACAMIHALVYNSNDRMTFMASIAPGLVMAIIMPFVAHSGSWVLPVLCAAATMRVIITTWLAHGDRLTLVSSVNLNRQQRQAAEQASQAKSQFLATMSHELRTPLNAVIGYAEILEEDLGAEGKVDSAADAARIRSAARNLLGLINEVLDFSKIEAGRMDIVEAPVDAGALAGEVIETCRHIAAANQSVIETNIAEDIGTVLTDGPRLRQCLLNLVSNACKFTTDGKVTVSARVETDGVLEFLHFDVADTGCGIAEDQAKRLFQPFVQADGSFTRKQGGTGLGLVITRKLAQLMGGDVTFVSEAGRGSTFSLKVNVGRPHIREAEMKSEGPLVVVIEDEAAARDLICRALARLPFRVRCASSAAEGMQFASEEPAALIVLDIYLPDRSGWDLLADLKADPATR
ncbi:MAG TPA: ATP-binding protein, partial [Caulobacterales bacterium]|nr:ATP-binding protein [Caulobacterales bacterium]